MIELLAAFKVARRYLNEYKLVIAGTITKVISINTMRPDNVILLGVLLDKDLNNILKQCKLFLCPNYVPRTGMELKLIDYIAHCHNNNCRIAVHKHCIAKLSPELLAWHNMSFIIFGSIKSFLKILLSEHFS